MAKYDWARLAGLAALVGPLILGTTIVGLSIVQYPFMRRLGWHPISASSTDWPSGLALGPYGILMVIAFACCGVLLVLFAVGFDSLLPPGPTGRFGPILLGVAGVAMGGLACLTDPTYIPTPRTLAGRIHDASFVLLGLSLLPALVLLPFRLRQNHYWRNHALLTWATVAILVPAFVVRGLAFYLFLACILGWFMLTGWRLYHAPKA